MQVPANNLLTDDRIELGKYLFYNPAMSKDSSISCSSCHLPEHAFTDQRMFSIGSDKQLGTSNSPSLANIGYHPYFTRAGGVNSLEIQVLVPIQEHNEFNFNLLKIESRLKQDSYFVHMAKKTYPDNEPYFAITASIASFERTLVSNQSRFDYYLNGLGTLNDQERLGMELFFSAKTNCSHCHGGFNFTDYSFSNNGAVTIKNDSGRYRITHLTSDIGQFKVPSLRNVALTAPYMHDGSIGSLKEVLVSYNKGGNNKAYTQNHLIKELQLSDKELAQLEAFLNTLTDYNFIQNPKFKH
ncbi:c-type cytochrome [Bacteroidia bacterium]|nr:c-type cytochrome [Bacteroidia bacterium]